MLIIVAALLQVATAAPLAGETFEPPVPPGFKVGYTTKGEGQSIEERVPSGETVEHWTRMITVQKLDGIARVGIDPFLQRLGELWIASCPGAQVSSLEHQAVDSIPTASLRADCPLNRETGKPETMFGRAFLGATDIYTVQYAFRSVPAPADVAIARDYLARVRLVR